MASASLYHGLDLGAAKTAAALVVAEMNSSWGKSAPGHRVSGYLADLLPCNEVEHRLLAAAYKHGAVRDLVTVNSARDVSAVTASVVKRMCSQHYTKAGSEFAVYCWAVALKLPAAPLTTSSTPTVGAVAKFPNVVRVFFSRGLRSIQRVVGAVVLLPIKIAKLAALKTVRLVVLPVQWIWKRLPLTLSVVAASTLIAAYVLFAPKNFSSLLFNYATNKPESKPAVITPPVISEPQVERNSVTPTNSVPQTPEQPPATKPVTKQASPKPPAIEKVAPTLPVATATVEKPASNPTTNPPCPAEVPPAPSHSIEVVLCNAAEFHVPQIGAVLSVVGSVQFEEPTGAHFALRDSSRPSYAALDKENGPPESNFTLTHNEHSCHMISRTATEYKFVWFYKVGEWWLLDCFVMNYETRTYRRYAFAYLRHRWNWWEVRGDVLIGLQPNLQDEQLTPAYLSKRSGLNQIALAFYEPERATLILNHLEEHSPSESFSFD